MTSHYLAVTGASGQLGQALRTLVPNGLFWTRENLDVTDEMAVHERLLEARPRVIVNAAAYTDVDKAEMMPDQAAATNERGARYVAETAAQIEAKVVFPSTNFVFAGTADMPYVEEIEPDPISVYGRTKAIGESETLRHEGNVVVRTSALYGKGHNFVRSIVARATDASEITVVDDQLCQPTSSIDLAKAILAMTDRDLSGIYHFTGAPTVSWADLAETALQIAAITTPVVRVTTDEYASMSPSPTAPRPRRAELDCSKVRRTGIEINDWKISLKEYLES